jgi:hypothetical protein
VEVLESARKHGVADADLRHAVGHHVRRLVFEGGPPTRVLYLGPNRAGNWLEVVVIERDDGTELAIHAMKARRKYRRLLFPRR